MVLTISTCFLLPHIDSINIKYPISSPIPAIGTPAFGRNDYITCK